MSQKPQAPLPVNPATVFPSTVNPLSSHPSFQQAAPTPQETTHIPNAFEEKKGVDNAASIPLENNGEDETDVWTPPATKVTKPFSPLQAEVVPPPVRPDPKPRAKVAHMKAQPSQYIFRLLNKPNVKVNVNGQLMDERQRTGQTSRLFLKMEDTILWPFISQAGKQIPLPLNEDVTELGSQDLQWLPRRIRYAYGLNTPFADEQEGAGIDSLKRENGRNAILDNPTNRDSLQFVNIEMRVPGNDSVRYNYLRLSNQCQNQHPKARRYGNSIAEYFMIDFAAEDRSRIDRGRLRQRMYELACTARVDEMFPHAKFLGIPLVIDLTGEDRESAAIREDYKDAALSNPDLFDRTFSDPKVKIVYWIQELVSQGDISIGNMIAGQAHWARTGVFITMLPPDKNPVEFLAEFTLTAQGEEFAQQIRAVRMTK